MRGCRLLKNISHNVFKYLSWLFISTIPSILNIRGFHTILPIPSFLRATGGGGVERSETKWMNSIIFNEYPANTRDQNFHIWSLKKRTPFSKILFKKVGGFKLFILSLSSIFKILFIYLTLLIHCLSLVSNLSTTDSHFLRGSTTDSKRDA